MQPQQRCRKHSAPAAQPPQGLQTPFGPLEKRDAAMATVRDLLSGNPAAAASGAAPHLLYRMLYLPEEGMFRLLPKDLRLGCYLHEEEDKDGEIVDEKVKKFLWDGQQYRVGDFVYLLATCALAWMIPVFACARPRCRSLGWSVAGACMSMSDLAVLCDCTSMQEGWHSLCQA